MRHITIIGPYNTDMLGSITEANTVVLNTDWVEQLVVPVVPIGDLQQLGLVVAEGDPVLPTVVLGDGKDVTQVCKLICS